MKGGGDAGTAAKAVTPGEADFAWNLQVTPDILKQMTDGGKALNLTPGGGVEKIVVNFTDPNKDGERREVQPAEQKPLLPGSARAAGDLLPDRPRQHRQEPLRPGG